MALYPVSLLLHAAQAMGQAAEALTAGESGDGRLTFDELRATVGWPAYDRTMADYDQEVD